MNDYTKLFTDKRSYITIGAWSNFLEQLPEKYFCLIHRSYAIAISKVSSLKKKGSGLR